MMFFNILLLFFALAAMAAPGPAATSKSFLNKAAISDEPGSPDPALASSVNATGDAALAELEQGHSSITPLDNDGALDTTGALLRFSCETSLASPWVSDCAYAAGILEGLPRSARCLNNWSTGCTPVIAEGNCELGVCGTRGASVNCNQMGGAVSVVIRYCSNGGRIGGTIYFDNTPLKALIYHRG